ncbi:MAG: PIN domain-containing protein [Patescibacteria group bacterium]
MVSTFSGWSAEELRAAECFLEENFTSVPFGRALARMAAEIRRNTKIKFPDAAIAALALETNTPLVTRNVRDFKRIAGLEIVTL